MARKAQSKAAAVIPPSKLPKPRPRTHVPAPDVRTGKGSKLAKPSGRNGNQLVTGGHPQNTGGKKGRSGRKPKAFKEFCRAVIENPDVQEAVLNDLTSPWANPSARASLLNTLASYVEEKPKQTLEHKGLRLSDIVGAAAEGDADTGTVDTSGEPLEDLEHDDEG